MFCPSFSVLSKSTLNFNPSQQLLLDIKLHRLPNKQLSGSLESHSSAQTPIRVSAREPRMTLSQGQSLTVWETTILKVAWQFLHIPEWFFSLLSSSCSLHAFQFNAIPDKTAVNFLCSPNLLFSLITMLSKTKTPWQNSVSIHFPLYPSSSSPSLPACRVHFM